MPEPVNDAPQFPATRWSIVIATAGSGKEARAALEELCRVYRFPLYAFARQNGCTPEDAEDETQDFLARAASGEILARATPQRGRLRTYLLAAFQRDLIDTNRRRNRQKRGGHFEFVSLECLNAEDRFCCTTLRSSAEATYDYTWAMSCLESATGKLEAEYGARGQEALFAALRAFLDPGAGGVYTADVIPGLDANAQRQAVFRLRQRFRVLLRQTVANTLESPTEDQIDEEILALRTALSG